MKKNIATLLIFNTIVLIFFNFAHPVTPAVLTDKNMPDSLNGILFSLMSLGMVISSPFWGRQISKNSAVKIMIVATMGYGISQQLLGFGDTALLMSLGRLFSGVFAAGWIVSTYHYVNVNIEKTSKTKFFGYIMVSNAAAGILGQLISGELGDLYSIYLPFIIQFVGLFITAIGIYIFLPEIKKTEENKIISNAKEINKKNKAIVNKFRTLKKTIEDKSIYILIITTILSMALVAYTSQIGYYVSTTLSGSSLQVGIINSYTSLITVIMNIYFVHKIETKIGEFKTLKYGMIVALIGILITINSNLGLVILGFTLLLLGLVMYRAVCQKYMLEISTIEQAQSIGYINSANAIGMVLGSFLTAFLYQISPIYIAYFIAGILIFGLIILLIFNVLLKKVKNKKIKNIS